MRYLLDTHAYIWWDSRSSELSRTVFNLLRRGNDTFWVSIASVWEMQIKLQTGRLKLRKPLKEIVENQQKTNNIQLLPITLGHVLALDSLPPHQ